MKTKNDFIRRCFPMNPNILLIMTDQQRYDSLGCYGFDGIQTPHLDQLAQEGVLFTNCYVNNPICTPSRASILSGKPLPGHGVYQLYDILPQEEVLFPERLQKLGYQTALVGKLHVSGAMFERDFRNCHDGFESYEWCHEPALFLDSRFNSYGQWLRENHNPFYERLKNEGRNVLHIPRELHFTHWAADRTIQFIKKRDLNKPFFCMMSLFDPHNPYEDYPLEMLQWVDPDKIPPPVGAADAVHQKPYGIITEHEHGYMGNFHRYSSTALQKMRIGYFASIALIDQEVGRVLRALSEEGLADNTMVIFVSDHGDMLGDHELLAKGAFFYDPCTKVPLIIRFPQKIGAGTIVDSLVQPHDLAATILCAAGNTYPQSTGPMPDAMDLRHCLTNEPGRSEAVCLYRNSGISDQGSYFNPPIHATMLREERFKLNLYHRNGSSEFTQGELYDMINDPDELCNLWHDPRYTGMKTQLMEQVMDWLVACDAQYQGSRGGTSDRVSYGLNSTKL